MQTYDILMAIVLIGAMLFGAIKGFAWQLASIASIVVSYAVAYHYREPFSQNIHAEPPWNRFLAMLILYVGTSLVIWVAFRMIGGTIDRMKLKEFDRQIGALFGLGKGAIYCTLITLFAVTLLGDRTRSAIIESRSGHWIAQLLDQSDAIMPEELASVVRPYLDQFESKFNPAGPLQPWLGEAQSPPPTTRFPAWQPEPNPAWAAGQNAASNSIQNFAPTPQWQQASGAAPWQQ
ncbi:membrane protein required for colicin V production [Rhodopirellula rubra]|uniref:Membrane protein required for colicin V production n=1 Tax=Aporhodopirellula rubra TaxID=980271 RepID=A0A7W5E201_9BACT|nr:CvpA family protein [Aporhodopirellula rubra]MBB3208309.1 membrane protein required for colicin V production [Aporhodopirellula rubra]